MIKRWWSRGKVEQRPKLSEHELKAWNMAIKPQTLRSLTRVKDPKLSGPDWTAQAGMKALTSSVREHQYYRSVVARHGSRRGVCVVCGLFSCRLGA